MIPWRELIRLIQMIRVILRYGLDELIPATRNYRTIRFFCRLFGGRQRKQAIATTALGQRIREALQTLGPIQVKFGQVLSTRRDLLPDDIADELCKLQDQVPPFPNTQAQTIIEQSLGGKTAELFAAFEPQPMASASIAQVHAAELLDGTQVVVKVVRPNIVETIDRDIQLLQVLARLAHRAIPDARRLRLEELVQDYSRTIHDELDLMREAANCALLRRNFAEGELLYVPHIYWDYTRENVMVQERIVGIPVDQIDQLQQQGINLKTLAEQGVEIFFTQVFRDNFFHADMHPGNIFVRADGRYLGVDFGIMGSLTKMDQRYLAENLLAFFHRDYRKVAELHVSSGWVPDGTRVEDFEAAIRSVCEPIWQRPISEISFGQFLLRLFQTARRFNMEIQPQLVLLQKTLLNIEGLGRQLYPELDLWQTAKPFLERWMAEQVGPWAFIDRLKTTFPELSEVLPALPQLSYQVLQQAAAGELQIGGQQTAPQPAPQSRNQQLSLTGASLLLSGALYSLADQPLLDSISQQHLVWLLSGSGIGLMLFGLFRK